MTGRGQLLDRRNRFDPGSGPAKRIAPASAPRPDPGGDYPDLPLIPGDQNVEPIITDLGGTPLRDVGDPGPVERSDRLDHDRGSMPAMNPLQGREGPSLRRAAKDLSTVPDLDGGLGL